MSLGANKAALMGAAGGAAADDFYTHQIANSCRTHDDTSSSIRRTPSSDGNRQTWCISMWVKRAKVSETQFIFEAGTSGDSGSRLFWSFVAGDGIEVSSGVTNYGTSTAIFRDTSAYYHIFIKNASGTNTVYINGTSVKSSSISGDTAVNSQVAHSIACRASGTGEEAESYVSEFLLFDGTAYDPTDLAENKNGVWIPKDPSGLTLSGTNTTWLKFTNASDLGEDFSGNNNDWTLGSAITSDDQMLDSPTFDGTSNGGNFATIGGLEKNTGGFTFSEGNLKYAVSTNQRGFIFSQGVPETGKYYWEVRATVFGGSEDQLNIGVCDPDKMRANLTGSRGGSQVSGAGGYTFDQYNGAAWLDGVKQSDDSIGYKRSAPQTFGFAIDRDNNTLKWTYDGSSYSSTYTIPSSGPLYPYIGSGGGSNTASGVFNFGADSTFAGLVTAGDEPDENGYGNFSLAVPSGYLALCAANLPTAEEVDPAQTDDDYPQKLFSPIIWTGNGATGRAITGLGFQSDFIWFKDRTQAFSNRLYDTTRGISGTGGKRLFSNTTGAETDQTSGQDISAVGSDGFTLGASDANYTNYNTDGNVAWCWRANGGTTSSGSGDLTSTYQVDPSGCFSIVSYTANGTNDQTFSHGLSAKPDMVIVKSRSQTANWAVYTSSQGATKYLKLNATTGITDSEYYWNDTEPTSSVVTVGDNTDVNYGSGQTYIAYCFANCEGYSSFGSYEGNGDADGVFVYCGFRPALVTTKRTDDVSSWLVHDNKRDTYNPVIEILLCNDSSAEFNGSNDRVDFLANGFKVRSSNSGINGDGNDYIYMAWSENPFQYATAR